MVQLYPKVAGRLSSLVFWSISPATRRSCTVRSWSAEPAAARAGRTPPERSGGAPPVPASGAEERTCGSGGRRRTPPRRQTSR